MTSVKCRVLCNQFVTSDFEQSFNEWTQDSGQKLHTDFKLTSKNNNPRLLNSNRKSQTLAKTYI